jgi:hypothetical protein
MTIAFGTIGAKSAADATPASIDVAYPATVSAGDLLVAGRVLWQTAGFVPSDEAGWTFAPELAGGTGTAADTHTTTVRGDYKVAVGGETGVVAFDQSGSPGVSDGAMGVMARYTVGAGSTWDVASFTANDAAHGANRSAFSASVTLVTGDMLVAIVAVDTDATLTISAPAFSGTGMTFGTVTQRTPNTAGITTGNDGNIEWFDALVTAGATAAVSLTFTTAISQCGPVEFIRLREVPAPPTTFVPVVMSPRVSW